MSEKPPPDFAMMRAVEILAQMHERVRHTPNTPPAPIDRPVVLRSERLSLQLGKTQRTDHFTYNDDFRGLKPGPVMVFWNPQEISN